MPEDVQRPSTDSDLITCATDILVRRYGCDVDEAGATLEDWSHETSLGVLTIAAWLIDDAAATGGRT